MNALIISVFALALAVVGLVYVAWTISEIRKLQAAVTDTRVSLASYVNELRQLGAMVDRTSNSKLAAEVEDLRAAQSVHRASVRKELGSLWGRLGGRNAEPHSAVIDTEDDEIAAYLQLQSAGPSGPK